MFLISILTVYVNPGKLNSQKTRNIHHKGVPVIFCGGLVSATKASQAKKEDEVQQSFRFGTMA